MAGRAWIKLYERWLHGPRHAGLPGEVLGFGAMLLLEAEALGVDDEAGTRWLLGPGGEPVGLDTVHRRARVRQRSGNAWAKKLLAVGTLVERSDGCLGFANYRQWQENPSSARVRKHRENRFNGVTCNVTCNREAEAEVEAEADYPPTPHGGQLALVDPPTKKRKPRKKKSEPTDAERGQVAHVLEHLNAAVANLNPAARGFKPTAANSEHILKRLRDGHGVDELIAVIDARATACRYKPDQIQWLNPSTPFRDRNWANSVASVNAQDTHALNGSIDPSSQNYDEEVPF